MTKKSKSAPLKDRKNLRITKIVNEIVRMLTSLTRDDLAKLNDELDGVWELIGELQGFISDEVTKQKKAEAKKAIKILIDEGFSFENIAIDDMHFEISKNKRIQLKKNQISNRDVPEEDVPEDDIPF